MSNAPTRGSIQRMTEPADASRCSSSRNLAVYHGSRVSDVQRRIDELLALWHEPVAGA
jgi:hypothetical protein